MTLRHFRIFVSVCEELNMTSAARKLYMTQPSVSQVIREMESHYQSELFKRFSNRLIITESGELVLQYARQILTLNQSLDEQLMGNNYRKKLSIGCNYTVASVIIHDILRRYSLIQPDILPAVTVNRSSVLIDMLRSGQADIALIEERPEVKDIIMRPFRTDRIALVVDSKDPLADRNYLLLSAVPAQRYLLREKGAGVRDQFDRTLYQQGISVAPFWESTSTTAIIQAVKHGYGIGVLPYELVREEIVAGHLNELFIPGLDFTRTLVIATLNRNIMFQELSDFIDTVLQMPNPPG